MKTVLKIIFCLAFMLTTASTPMADQQHFKITSNAGQGQITIDFSAMMAKITDSESLYKAWINQGYHDIHFRVYKTLSTQPGPPAQEPLSATVVGVGGYCEEVVLDLPATDTYCHEIIVTLESGRTRPDGRPYAPIPVWRQYVFSVPRTKIPLEADQLARTHAPILFFIQKKTTTRFPSIVFFPVCRMKRIRLFIALPTFSARVPPSQTRDCLSFWRTMETRTTALKPKTRTKPRLKAILMMSLYTIPLT